MSEKKRVILCVDDEMSVLETLQNQLKSMFGNKYLIELAESGEEAIEVLDDFIDDGYDPILIITDWLMPGMKGDDFLVNIKDRENNAIKILLTGHAPEESVERAFKEGGLHHYVSKPWSKDDLEKKLVDIL